MEVQHNVSLAPFTAYKTGGKAENFIELESYDSLQDLTDLPKPVWFLGNGTNSLISDKGLPGTTILMATSDIKVDGELVIADSGVWWDDLVDASIQNGLWGLELMSEIPGSVGAAVVGNIAAYGQAVADTLIWIEAFDLSTGKTSKVQASDLDFGYRYSMLQEEKSKNIMILRVAFDLSKSKTTKLEYGVALKVAAELGLDASSLQDARKIIIAARTKQGSILRRGDKTAIKTTGSFFRNPTVSEEMVDKLVEFDDWGMSKQQILQQNKVHGGSKLKISAALVMLAAGYKSGHSWGDVRLHPSHVLKVENVSSETSQQIYDISQEIIENVKQKVGVELVPEVRFLGDFS